MGSIRTPDAFTDYPFDQPFVLIGNRPDADLNIIHPDVEPRHLLLQILHGRAFVLNLASQPIRFPQQSARGEGWLARGDRIEFGEFILEVISDHTMKPGEGRMPSPTQSPAATGRELICEVLDVKLTNNTCRIRRELVLLGNSRRTKITLITPAVSSIHCVFVRTVMGYWVVDLCGKGGITIDGRTVRCAQVLDGSLLVVGNLRLRLGYQIPTTGVSEGVVELGVTAPELGLIESGRSGNLSPARLSVTAKAIESKIADEPMPLSRETALAGASQPLVFPNLDLQAVFANLQESVTRQFQQTFDQMIATFKSMLEAQMAQVREEFERVLKKVLNAQLGQGERFTPEELPFAEIVMEVVNKSPSPDHSGNRPVPPPDLHLWFLNQLKGLTGR